MTDPRQPRAQEDDSTAFYPLRGDRILLRPLRDDHVPALCVAANNPQVTRLTATLPCPYEESDGRAFLDASRAVERAGSGINLVIEERADRRFLGVIGLKRKASCGVVGYWLRQESWGQGYASEALRLLAIHAFDDLGYRRLVASHLDENQASGRVLEKCGFVADGRRTVSTVNHGTVDCPVWVLTREAFAKATRNCHLVLVSAVALVDADNRVLLQQRPQGKHLAGLWEFPGGKVDPGETPEQALVRELREELGIEAHKSHLVPLSFASHAYEDFHLLMTLYLCRRWRGRVECREGQVLAWVRRTHLDHYPMPPADVPLLPFLLDALE